MARFDVSCAHFDVPCAHFDVPCAHLDVPCAHFLNPENLMEPAGIVISSHAPTAVDLLAGADPATSTKAWCTLLNWK